MFALNVCGDLIRILRVELPNMRVFNVEKSLAKQAGGVKIEKHSQVVAAEALVNGFVSASRNGQEEGRCPEHEIDPGSTLIVSADVTDTVLPGQDVHQTQIRRQAANAGQPLGCCHIEVTLEKDHVVGPRLLPDKDAEVR